MMRQSAAVETGAIFRAADMLRAVGCAAFVFAAVVAEAVAGSSANSPEPSWAQRAFPLGWPQPARVLWWLGVAAAAFGYRVFLRRAGLPGRRAITVLVVVPFVLFAFGVATGAQWSTWH